MRQQAQHIAPNKLQPTACSQQVAVLRGLGCHIRGGQDAAAIVAGGTAGRVDCPAWGLPGGDKGPGRCHAGRLCQGQAGRRMPRRSGPMLGPQVPGRATRGGSRPLSVPMARVLEGVAWPPGKVTKAQHSPMGGHLDGNFVKRTTEPVLSGRGVGRSGVEFS
eukprot:1967929-Prymnesium_polylepis.1